MINLIIATIFTVLAIVEAAQDNTIESLLSMVVSAIIYSINRLELIHNELEKIERKIEKNEE